MDQNGKKKFKVLILTGGEGYGWFSDSLRPGITCQDVRNILDFVHSGGSIIGICICSSSLFVDVFEFKNPNLFQASFHQWDATNTFTGWFKHYCDIDPPFKGIVSGPKESNRPYPTTRFLPIRMNPENEIVKTFNMLHLFRKKSYLFSVLYAHPENYLDHP